MATLVVPPLPDEEEWPTLGPQICDFIEGHDGWPGLIFGPGDLRGEPAVLDGEKRALIHRIYQVFPRGHDRAGRRRFKKCTVEMVKGTAKTELAAWIAAAELHANGPVRCGGWRLLRGEWIPDGVAVTDPYIPMLAFTEDQAEELAYGALKVILNDAPIAPDFDVGEERIVRADGTGRCEAVAGSPNARDGARTSFQHFDEPHRMYSPRLKEARTTMLGNIPKRFHADAWTLDTSTRHDPGQGSVHQDEYETAQQIKAGLAHDPTFFFFSRHASTDYAINEPGELRQALSRGDSKQLRRALKEAAGPAASSWRDFDAIIGLFSSPKADLAYLCRVYLNWTMRGAGRAFNVDDIATRLVDRREIPKGEAITLGFDGSRNRDATGIVATHVLSGYQWKAGCWERPADADPEWEVPRREVDDVVDELFDRYLVVWMNADPEWWDETVGAWAGRYNRPGREGQVVREHYTNQPKRMGLECRAYAHAINAGEATFDGDEQFLRHLANAIRKPVPYYTEDSGHREQLWVITKEHRSSPLVIDLAMGGVLSWDARIRALAAGLGKPRKRKGTLITF